jgi:RNA polymerase sigma-B factor
VDESQSRSVSAETAALRSDVGRSHAWNGGRSGYSFSVATALRVRNPHADESELWELANAGDDEARAQLVERYIRLAQTLARRYTRTSEPLEDIEQVACIGLMNAVDRFDPDRGTRFSTFAVPTILGEIRRHFRDRTWAVRVPRDLRDAASSIEHSLEASSAQLGRSPSAAEIAEVTGRSIEQVVAAREAALAYRCDSLDRPVATDDGDGQGTLADRIGACDEGLSRAEDGVLLDQLATASLSARDREVVRLRVQEDLLQREIAERVGVSQMQVSRILRDALQRLQRSVR